MNRIWILSVCLMYTAYVRGYESGINLYSFRYNTLDLDTILNSDRLVKNYVECLLSRKPCSPEGKELKRLLPEALRTKCAKCSVQQKEGALKVLTKLYTKYPQYYNDLRARWDRTGEYHRRFLEYLREEKFNGIPNGIDYDKDQSQVNTQEFKPNRRIPQQTIPDQIPQATSPNAPQQTTPSQNVPEFDIGNRFSEDDLSGPLQPEASAIPEASIVPSSDQNQTPMIVPEQPKRPSMGPNIAPTMRPKTTTSTPIISSTSSIVFRPNLFYIPSNQPNGSPLIGIINRIGSKITTTADLIAEMLRGTVKTS